MGKTVIRKGPEARGREFPLIQNAETGNWKLETGKVTGTNFKFPISNFNAKIQNQSRVSRDKMIFACHEGY